jgi:hypothetical protein
MLVNSRYATRREALGRGEWEEVARRRDRCGRDDEAD